MYQGHHSDGSSIQAHSVGGLYPYIVFAQGADKLQWGVLSPDGGTSRLYATYDQAADHAASLKA